MTVVHGGLRPAELEALGLDPSAVLDLSANLHPCGPHPRVLAAMRGADVTRYPDPEARLLRDAIAERRRLDPAEVLVTAGATDALHLAARALLREGDRCALFPPTFGEYEAAVRLAGGVAVEHRAQPDGFEPPLAEVDPAPLAFLCNPNNPTGVHLARVAVEALLERVDALVLDAAYEPFVQGAWDADDLVRAGAPVLVVHSFTKLHTIPGLRVGYVTGRADLVGRLARLRHAWPVGAPEIAAGLACLEVEDEQSEAAREAAATRERLRRCLLGAGLSVAPSRANFLLVRVGDAAAFRARLLRRGFAVRDCASFGLPEWVRIAVPAEAEASRLLEAALASVEGA